MPSVDELWAWVATPIEELSAQHESDRDKPWAELRAYFVEQAGLSDPSEHPLVAELVRRLDEMPDEERDALLDDRDRLENHVRQLCEQYAVEDETGDGAGYDEAEWQRFLLENGVRWDGTEESWSQFTEWFAYAAAEAGVGQPATSLVEFLDGQSVSERIATLAQYGVTIQAPVAADSTGYDEAAWQEFLVANAPQWNGAEDTWEQFKEWFAYTAGEAGLSEPATSLLEFLDTQSVPDRVITFAQYGVTIESAGEAAGPVEITDEQFEEILAESAQFEGIPEERRKELINEVLGRS